VPSDGSIHDDCECSAAPTTATARYICCRRSHATRFSSIHLSLNLVWIECKQAACMQTSTRRQHETAGVAYLSKPAQRLINPIAPHLHLLSLVYDSSRILQLTGYGRGTDIETAARYVPGASKQHIQGAVKNEPLMSTDRERKNDATYCLLSPGSAGSTSTLQINF